MRARCVRLLCAAMPNGGASTRVEYSEHHDSGRFHSEEYRVGEATCPNTANIAMHDWETVWILADQAKSTFYLRGELGAKAPTPLFVPECGVVEFALRRAPKDDRSSHRLRRSAIAALTSSHETTSFGFAS